jgi:hypothetical protein
MSTHRVTSVRGTETLSFAQRDRLGRVIRKELPVHRATVYSLGERGHEIEVVPAVNRIELESVVGKFVADRIVDHQPSSIIETDR